jgi:hypothetical protein
MVAVALFACAFNNVAGDRARRTTRLVGQPESLVGRILGGQLVHGEDEGVAALPDLEVFVALPGDSRLDCVVLADGVSSSVCLLLDNRERKAVVDRFLQLFGRFVESSYAVWDRIVLRGYYERLQRPENIVYFFRDVIGVPCITPKVLAERTERYRKWVAGYASKRGVAIVNAPKGVRRDELVVRYYRRFRQEQGVVVILRSMEQGPTFVSYEPRRPAPSGPNYRVISRANRKLFMHYDFYILDPVVGPMSVRVGTYLPFSVNCYMNGHSYLAAQLRNQQVLFRKQDSPACRLLGLATDAQLQPP